MSAARDIKAVAETGIPLATMIVATRALTGRCHPQTAVEYYPRGSRGRGAQPEATAHSWAAILIAVGSFSVTAAADAVDRYADLQLASRWPIGTTKSVAPDLYETLDSFATQAASLGLFDFLAKVIDWLSDEDTDSPAWDKVSLEFDIENVVGGLSASIGVFRYDGASASSHTIAFYRSETTSELPVHMQSRSAYRFSFHTLLTIASCLRAAKARLARSEPGSSPDPQAPASAQGSESEKSSPASEETSTPKRLGDSTCLETYQDRFSQRPDGRSPMPTESSPVCVPTPPAIRSSHDRDHRQPVLA